MKSDSEHRYTSTGIKFWRHMNQMEAFRRGDGNTVISTHVAPEGACNLRCIYCSVTYRDTHSRISLDVIKDYIEKLQTRGLKAVILTGGGEPTAYKHFNELVEWLHWERELSVGLITNGTLSDRVAPGIWKAFSWVRVSINLFDGWEEKILIPSVLTRPDCVVGCSMVYTGLHEKPEGDWEDVFRRAAKVASHSKAKYVRILPNCLLPQEELKKDHEKLDLVLDRIGDPRFFHQYKLHRAPTCGTCHQAHFRPYLSEEIYVHDDKGEAGAVYPCDSVVLNDARAKFTSEYQICKPGDVLDFLDGKIKQRFDPRELCSGCVFTDNVEMLDRWKTKGEVSNLPEEGFEVLHEEFV